MRIDVDDIKTNDPATAIAVKWAGYST